HSSRWEVVRTTADQGAPAAAGAPTEFDIVVVGGGPGGYAVALYAGAAGLSVGLVEMDKVGGTCLHRGCVPAKEFLETASVYRTVAGAKEFGIQAGQPTVEFATSQARKGKVVEQLWKGLQGLLAKRKVTTFIGRGRYIGGKVVEVTGEDGTTSTISGRSIVLAAGSVPRTIPGFEVDGRYVMTSDEVLDLEALPRSAVVIGGGAIGCEFASMMSDLGVPVTMLEALPKILPGCDRDVADVVVRSFKKRGIDVRTGVAVKGHTPGADGTTVHFGEDESVDVDVVVVSVGRRPLSDGLLGPDSGVAVDERGFVAVDEWLRTGAEGVFAVGDLIATPQLAHVGFAEAILVVKQILGERAFPVDYGTVPWAIYCHPEVAFAGHTEESAAAAGFEILVKKDPFGGNSRARILGETEGVVKVICEKLPDGKAGRILGVHMVGPWVTEQLGAGYLAINWEATPDEVAQFIQPHPSLSEAFGETVLALTGRGLHVG
ncbi:MAG TPA: dihydrolipoyl dehydrogenase, partial [Acidimicrobiales bacterium]|nr:dihydrolipoyl dehydrogenase [Acidimicrobiales bacterium]